MKRSAALIALAVAACGPSVKSISVEPARSVLEAKGASAPLRAVAKDGEGKPVDASRVKVAWSSSAPQTATVDEAGNVTAQRSGEAVVTAAVGEVKGAAQVVVSIPVSVSVSAVSRDLHPGETVVLSVVVVDDAGKPVTVPRTITWSSSDAGVARVEDGKVEAVGPGSATITAGSGSLKGTSAVRVRVPEFSRLALTPAKSQKMKKGDRLTFKVAAVDRKGQKVGGVPVAWRSSNPKVATVSAAGVVSAVTKGSAKITASATGKAATVGVTVTDAPKAKAKPKKK